VDGPVPPDDLDVRRGAAASDGELGQAFRRPRWRGECRGPADQLLLRAKLVVDLAAKLAPYRDVGDGDRDGDPRGDGEGAQQDEASAQRHGQGSRST
jgi:hypothetical protein